MVFFLQLCIVIKVKNRNPIIILNNLDSENYYKIHVQKYFHILLFITGYNLQSYNNSYNSQKTVFFF